jgi:GAF domain-containing protein
VPLCGIADMSTDAHLGTSAFVKGEPYLKSFWGTPVCTANGYKIGVLWMLDDKVRAELTEDHIRFIGQVLAGACLFV